MITQSSATAEEETEEEQQLLAEYSTIRQAEGTCAHCGTKVEAQPRGTPQAIICELSRKPAELFRAR